MPALRKSPIKNSTWALMIGVALLYWVIGLIPFVDWLVDVIYLLTFWLWFRLHGIKFNSPGRIATMGISAVVEAIPVVSAIPAMPLAIIVMYLLTRLPPEVAKAAGAGNMGTNKPTGSNIPNPEQ